MDMLRQFGGLEIRFDMNALEKTEQRLFPSSKHRSKRILKKLIKRFGGEFKMKPCMFQMGNIIIAHPVFRAELQRIAARP